MRRIRVLFLALLTGIAAPAVAQSSDSSQPIRIQADSATLDDRKNVAIYTGNVIITQGSMRLTGARVTLTLDNAGEVQKLVSNGSPATFRQTPAGGKQVDARAQTIEYHADTERVVLIQNAFLEQAGNTFQGQRVNYDIQRKVVDAGRAIAEEGDSAERIEIVIQPRKRTEPVSDIEKTSDPRSGQVLQIPPRGRGCVAAEQQCRSGRSTRHHRRRAYVLLLQNTRAST